MWPGFQESNTKLPGKGNSNYTLIRKSQTELGVHEELLLINKLIIKYKQIG